MIHDPSQGLGAPWHICIPSHVTMRVAAATMSQWGATFTTANLWDLQAGMDGQSHTALTVLKHEWTQLRHHHQAGSMKTECRVSTITGPRGAKKAAHPDTMGSADIRKSNCCACSSSAVRVSFCTAADH